MAWKMLTGRLERIEAVNAERAARGQRLFPFIGDPVSIVRTRDTAYRMLGEEAVEWRRRVAEAAGAANTWGERHDAVVLMRC